MLVCLGVGVFLGVGVMAIVVCLVLVGRELFVV